MSTFKIEKKLNDVWIALPNIGVESDTTGTMISLMKKFSGMVFDTVSAGSHNLPTSEIALPNGDTVLLGCNIATTMAISAPLRLCFGFIMLDNVQIFSDGDYQILTTIDYDGQSYATFKCTFTIINNVVANYSWQNAGLPSEPMVVRMLNCNMHSDCFPVLFAVEESDAFNDSFELDEVNNEIPITYGLNAKWMKPIGYVAVNKAKINFFVVGNGVGKFNMPNYYLATIGSTITLPTYASLYKDNYKPLKWRINGVEYPLGEKITVPDEEELNIELLYTLERVEITFSVSGIGANEFNIPQGYTANVGSTITLPTYESVFKNSYIPYGWLIDNVEYALGSSFTVPDHNVTANLIYNDKRYSGYVF